MTTGCSRFVSMADLKKECGLETLPDSRFNHRIILFNEMQNGLVPKYLCDLVSQTVGSTMSHNFRNSHNIHKITFRTCLRGNSFLPSAIRECNGLSLETSHSLNILK